jgi:hypothetical protein
MNEQWIYLVLKKSRRFPDFKNILRIYCENHKWHELKLPPLPDSADPTLLEKLCTLTACEFLHGYPKDDASAQHIASP